MPIWLRRFTASSIKEHYEKEKEAQEEAHRKAKGIENATSQNTKVLKPAIKSPTYSTKASTK